MMQMRSLKDGKPNEFMSLQDALFEWPSRISLSTLLSATIHALLN